MRHRVIIVRTVDRGSQIRRSSPRIGYRVACRRHQLEGGGNEPAEEYLEAVVADRWTLVGLGTIELRNDDGRAERSIGLPPCRRPDNRSAGAAGRQLRRPSPPSGSTSI